jgi:histone H2B
MAKSAKAATKKAGSRRRPHHNKFNSFINRVNKNAKKGLTLSSKSVKILNSFVHDMFDKIATQAAAVARANKKSTIKAAEIQTAVRLQLPADLAKHSISEASKAVTAAFK